MLEKTLLPGVDGQNGAVHPSRRPPNFPVPPCAPPPTPPPAPRAGITANNDANVLVLIPC